jgi:membrane-bound serine protease (ClpP class)
MDYLTLAYLLIVLGLVLLVAELFVPSGGVLFVLALICLVVGVVMTFMYGGMTTGILTLVGVFIAVPVLVAVGFHYWPKTPIGKRMFQTGPEEDATVASMPVNVELEQLRGKFGRAVSALRPAGVVDFDGRRVDVLTEGMLVEPGTWVRCIDVKSGKVIVRPLERPPTAQDLENAPLA